MFHYLTAGGPIFLHSQMTRGKVGLVSPFTSSYAFKLHSDVAEWDGSPDTDGMAMKVNRSQEEKQDD